MILIAILGLVFLSKKDRRWIAQMRLRMKHCQTGNSNPALSFGAIAPTPSQLLAPLSGTAPRKVIHALTAISV